MQRSSFREMNCSIGQSLEVVGEWWSLLIIRDAFMGVTRFDDFQERLGIARNVLNQRLSHLVDEGVFERVRLQRASAALRLRPHGTGPRSVASGRRTSAVGRPLASPRRAAPPVGAPSSAATSQSSSLVCRHCGEPVGPTDVSAVAGAGSFLDDRDCEPGAARSEPRFPGLHPAALRRHPRQEQRCPTTRTERAYRAHGAAARLTLRVL